MPILSKLKQYPTFEQLKKNINPKIFKILATRCLNAEELFEVNNIIEHKRILRYTGSTFHLVPFLINVTAHKCKITDLWKIFHFLLIITSFLNHKYKTKGLYILDLLTVIVNSLLGLCLFYKNIKKFSWRRILVFWLLFAGSAFAYIYGYITNTFCFDNRLGYLCHAICHSSTALSCVLLLYPH